MTPVWAGRGRRGSAKTLMWGDGGGQGGKRGCVDWRREAKVQ